MEQIKDFLDYTLFSIGKTTIHVYSLVGIVVIFLLARIILWLIKKFLQRKVAKNSIDPGKSYAILQIFSYVIYTLAILLSIDSIGIKITVLFAGSAALLVGLGLGLQDLFRDFIAGFIILSERAVTAGDIVNIDGTVGMVREVGLRTTSLVTRDDIVLIVPNQKLTSNNLVNWSQNNKTTRFNIEVGVAYGSDTQLVKKLLLDCVSHNPHIKKKPAPQVQFQNFGNSSLDFSIYFYSDQLFQIEKIKSDIRFDIDQEFRDNKVTIPFPQRDLWVRQMPSSE
tara:strand:- start:4028 stop:4870 length:843 start_codon:yes stop_codon:yes gene_type:complete